ncbi:hypothetical protein JXM67_07005 [candidate division WOR-3 bacterium]|nr:hypothetical protein [candidate division WOR-3 bacterium]
MRKKAYTALLAALLLTLTVLPGCRERFIFDIVEATDWLLVAGNDPNEAGADYNGSDLYVNTAQLTAGNLSFKMETHGSIPDPATDVIMSIYLDTDQSLGTGYTGWGGDTLVPNDIGAEYMLLVGTEPASGGGAANTDRLLGWNAGHWDDIYQITVSSNADSLIATVDMDSIGNPSAINVVAIMVCDPDGANLEDHIPNTGHATVTVNPPQAAQYYDPDAVQEVYTHPGKYISFVTGKEIDIEEVQ